MSHRHQGQRLWRSIAHAVFSEGSTSRSQGAGTVPRLQTAVLRQDHRSVPRRRTMQTVDLSYGDRVQTKSRHRANRRAARGADRTKEASALPSNTTTNGISPKSEDRSSLLEFFTPRKLPTSAQQDTSEAQRDRCEKLLNLCNIATYHARDSAADEHLHNVRNVLLDAAKLYMELIAEAAIQHTKEVYYESYLIRSTYIAVIRTIAAVNGVQSIAACVEMMKDYLHLEKTLWEKGIKSFKQAPAPFDVVKTTAQIIAIKREQSQAYLEWAFYQSPLPQDIVPTLYDIFQDLRDCNYEQKPASGEYQTHRELAESLIDAVQEVPFDTWSHPITPAWTQFRYSRYPVFRDAGQLLAACHQLHIRKLIAYDRLEDAYSEIKRFAVYCNGEESLRNATWDLSTRLHLSFRYLSEKAQESQKDAEVPVGHLLALREILLDLAEGGIATPSTKITGRRFVITHWSNVMKNVLQLFRLPLDEAGRESQARQEIAAIAEKFVDRLAFDANETLQATHELVELQTFLLNAPTKYLVMRGLQRTDKAMDRCMFKLMSILGANTTTSALYDDACLTMLKEAEEKQRSPYFIHGLLQAMYGKEMQKRLNEAITTMHEPYSPVAAILEGAVRQDNLQGMDTIITILSTVQRILNKMSPSSGDPQEARDLQHLKRYITTADSKLIQTLYPYLVTARKLNPRLSWHRNKRSLPKHGFSMRYHVPNTPHVALAALDFARRRGRTGLAERIWVIMTKICARSVDMPKQQDVPLRLRMLRTIPASGYTTMFKVYQKEVALGLRQARRWQQPSATRPSPASLHVMNIRRAHQWGDRLTRLPPAKASPSAILAALQNAQACYESLRHAWLQISNGPIPANLVPTKQLYISLFRVFQTDFRKQPHTADVRGYADTSYRSFLEQVRRDMAYFSIAEKDCYVLFWDNDVRGEEE